MSWLSSLHCNSLCICVGIVAVENSTVATGTLMGNPKCLSTLYETSSYPTAPPKENLWHRHWAYNPVLKKCAVQHRLIAATCDKTHFSAKYQHFLSFHFFAQIAKWQSIITYCSSKGIAQLYYVFFLLSTQTYGACFIITVLAKWFFYFVERNAHVHINVF